MDRIKLNGVKSLKTCEMPSNAVVWRWKILPYWLRNALLVTLRQEIAANKGDDGHSVPQIVLFQVLRGR